MSLDFKSVVLSISIHALTRSATLSMNRNRRNQFISIHALTRSATRALCLRTVTIKNFNPRTHKECD